MKFAPLFALEPALAVVVFKDHENGLEGLENKLSFDDLMTISKVANSYNLRLQAFRLAEARASCFAEHHQVLTHPLAQGTPEIDRRGLRHRALASMAETASTLQDHLRLFRFAQTQDHVEIRDSSATKVKELAKSAEDLCLVLQSVGAFSLLGVWAIEQLHTIGD